VYYEIGVVVREMGARRRIIWESARTPWNDEVYCAYYGLGGSGCNQSIVQADDVILTVAGTCDELESGGSWDAAIGKSDIRAIRWKLV
jgi:hypothetical protein